MSNFSMLRSLALGTVLTGFLAVPCYAQLDSALNAAKSSTQSSAASQQRVESLDDEADNMLREYRAVLQQRDNICLLYTSPSPRDRG